jgi:hypothetical protein
MSKAIDRVLAIEERLDELWRIRHTAEQEVASLRREKSSILLGITFAERQKLDRAMADRVGASLDQISAVRAGK